MEVFIMTRPVQIVRPRSVFTITTIGSSVTPARECAPVRLIPLPADQQPAAVTTAVPKDHTRARRAGLVLVGVVVDVIILGLGGLALGRSQLGHAILAGIAAALLALVLLLTAVGGRVHCPGCPR
jgi:hypothetical protein